MAQPPAYYPNMPNLKPFFDTLNQAVLRTFAEPCELTTPTGPVIFSGVFDQQTSQEGVAGVGFGDRFHTLTVLQNVIDASQISPKQTVTVRGKPYSIFSIQDDIGGMAVLTLRTFT